MGDKTTAEHLSKKTTSHYKNNNTLFNTMPSTTLAPCQSTNETSLLITTNTPCLSTITKRPISHVSSRSPNVRPVENKTMGECDVSKILDGALLKRKKLLKMRKSCCSRRVVGNVVDQN